MRRIVFGGVMAAALLACSDDPGRRPADESAARPTETARVDSGLMTIEDAAGAKVSPVEEQPPRPPEPAARPIPAPAPATDSTPEPVPVPAVRDTVVSGPPAAPPDTAPSPTPPEDTASALPAETAPAPPPARVPPPARPPDTVGTARPLPPASPSPRLPSMDGSSATRGGTVTLPAGTEFHAALVDSIHSRHDTAGQSLSAKVMENVRGPDGSTLIPAGSTVRLTVVRLEPAKSKSAADGTLELRIDGITRGNDLLEVAAEVRPVPHELRGRGVTGSEAAKVGAGAAAGAIAGRVLGGDTRGAVIGGVVGAAGGAAVASQTADRDVVVKAGTPISFVLTAPLVAGRL